MSLAKDAQSKTRLQCPSFGKYGKQLVKAGDLWYKLDLLIEYVSHTACIRSIVAFVTKFPNLLLVFELAFYNSKSKL